MVRASLVWPRRDMLLLTRQFAIPVSPEDKFWDNYFDVDLGPHGRPFETLQKVHDFQTEYGMPPGDGKAGPGKGVPKNIEGRKPRYLFDLENSRVFI